MSTWPVKPLMRDNRPLHSHTPTTIAEAEQKFWYSINQEFSVGKIQFPIFNFPDIYFKSHLISLVPLKLLYRPPVVADIEATIPEPRAEAVCQSCLLRHLKLETISVSAPSAWNAISHASFPDGFIPMSSTYVSTNGDSLQSSSPVPDNPTLSLKLDPATSDLNGNQLCSLKFMYSHACLWVLECFVRYLARNSSAYLSSINPGCIWSRLSPNNRRRTRLIRRF